MKIAIQSDCDKCLSPVETPNQHDMTQHYVDFLLAQIHHHREMEARAMLYCRLGDTQGAYACLSQAVNS